MWLTQIKCFGIKAFPHGTGTWWFFFGLVTIPPSQFIVMFTVTEQNLVKNVHCYMFILYKLLISDLSR